MTVYAVVNQKGGTGKTTTAVNLAAALGELGERVLVVDLDPQANATLHAGLELAEGEPTMWTAIHADLRGDDLPDPLAVPPLPEASSGPRPEGAPPAPRPGGILADCIRRAPRDAFDIVPSSLDLAQADADLLQAFNRERRLSRLLDPLRGEYQHILIDCPPYLGLLTINALGAADQVLVPVQAEFLAMAGLRTLLRTVARVRRDLNYRLEVGGILITHLDRRTVHSQTIATQVRQALSQYYHVFQIMIPINVDLANAAAAKCSVLAYAPTSTGAKAYRALAAEVRGWRHASDLQTKGE
jgi:chromosome partitioning protein